LYSVGRTVLSGRHPELDGEARRQTGRWHGDRSQVLRRVRRTAQSSGPSGRRRRFFRLILLLMSGELAASSTLFLLGAYHGINPGMGWLFAVARGMQEHRARAVAWSLPPMALGHALAIGVVVLVAGLARAALPLPYVRVGVAVVLVGLGLCKLIR